MKLKIQFPLPYLVFDEIQVIPEGEVPDSNHQRFKIIIYIFAIDTAHSQML